MYNIFFHIAGIAFIEIIFYFYYIGPIETNIFQDSVKKIVKPLKSSTENNMNPIVIVSPYNTSEYIIIEKNEENNITQILKHQVDKANDERDKENHELFIRTIKLWSCLFAFCILLLLIEERKIIYKYMCKKRKLEKTISISDMDIEMVQRASLQPICNNSTHNNNSLYDIENEVTNDTKKYDEDEDDDYYKKIRHNIIHYTILSIGVLGFEYLFFQYVIMKYHVISTEELEYLLYEMTLPLLHKYIEVHND